MLPISRRSISKRNASYQLFILLFRHVEKTQVVT